MTPKQDYMFIFLAVFVCLEYLLTIVINALSSLPDDPIGWFPNSTGGISDKYNVDITPAGWTFSIWGIIYTWMTLWLLYIFSSICRRNKNGPVYLNPPAVTASFLAVFSLNLAFNMTWLFLFSRELFQWSVADSCLLAFSAYVCLYLSHTNVEKHREIMTENHKFDYWCNRVLIQNGIAVYATWTSIATLLNFAITLTYNAGVPNATSCTVSLSILTAELVVYFVLDMFYWDRYLRYTLTVYLTVIWALTGALVAHWDPESSVSIFTAVLLGLGSGCFLVKVAVLIYRSKNQPLSRKESSESLTKYDMPL